MSTFICPCYIHRNSKELRQRLEDLGYIDEFPEELHEGKLYTFACASSHTRENSTIETTNRWNGDLIGNKTPISCGRNTTLFLALAALAEDTDYCQWFVHKSGAHWWMVTEKGLSFAEDFSQCNDDPGLRVEDFHKASMIELITKFPPFI